MANRVDRMRGVKKTKNKRGRKTVINMKGNEQMPIMNMNNEREGGASWCHMWHEKGEDDKVGPGSRSSATKGGPESSSLSTMSIIDVGPLSLIAVRHHPS